MYHTIHEPIQVAGVYEQSRFRPMKFRWQNRLYVIHEICTVHDFRDGSVNKRRFSVTSSGNVYLLEFDRYRETWFLEQVWVEN
jgi:hypothetical protein